MTLPDKSKIRFMLCDEVRLEMGNKLAILGFFPNNSVNLPHAQGIGPDPVQALTFIFLIEDGEGDFKARVDITDPFDNVLFSHDVGQLVKPENTVAVAIVRIAPFKASVWGRHSARLYLEDTSYTHAFVLNPA
jgi:hypothetical protein